MEKYKVKVIQISLKNNKLANSGELVNESQLNGNAAELVNQGFIEKVVDKDAEKKAAKAAKEAEEAAEAARIAEEEAKVKEAFDEGTLNADQLDSITMKEIYEYAKKHSYKYEDGLKKTELIEQVLKADKVEE